MIHVANCHGHKLDARNYQDWLKGCAFFAAIGAKFDTLACWSTGVQDFDLDAAKATWLAAGGEEPVIDETECGDLPPHMQRVVAEKFQLGNRLSDLNDFIGSARFLDLSVAEQSLLISQSGSMTEYFYTLDARIKAFTKVGG